MTSLILKPDREKSLLRRHPWVFSNAIGTVNGTIQPGETIELYSSKGRFLGRGAYSPRSQIRVRMWTFEEEPPINADFFRSRIKQAVSARTLYARDRLTACRLVFGESDGLPGLIVDRYGETLVCQFLSAGAEFWKSQIIHHLAHLVPNTGIYERSDVDVRKKEGLPPSAGPLTGQAPPDLVEVREGDFRFLVDIRNGHKTGFYIDQRENRARIMEYAPGAEVLNCFSYTGGFTIPALSAGAARVTSVDVSASSLELVLRNIELNSLDPGRSEMVEADAFTFLRQCRDRGIQFDVIVLDPPKFAESRAQVQRASRGYKDINLLAVKLLRKGGTLLTFSCSGAISPDLFQKIVAGAALDADRDVQIVRQLWQGPDHPTALCFPEAGYLKGLVCKVW
ncbi:MAG: class I SAM-dependent methyltransferase [Pseudomonadota bacterium]